MAGLDDGGDPNATLSPVNHGANANAGNNGAWGSVSYSDTGDSGAANWTSANITSEQYLEMMLGPRQVALKELLPMTIIYVIMFLTGVAGNVAVCVVIIKNRSMHTATNYYLFSLAVSDLVILTLGLPNELAGFWHQYPYLQGEAFCKIRSYVSELASYASVLTIVAFSVERYLAICHPLHVFESSDFGRVIRVLSVGWSVAALSAIPYLLFTKINYIDFPWGSGNYLEDSAFCALLDINIAPQNYPIHELSFLMFFLLPSAVLLYLYTSMAVTLKGSIRKGSVCGQVHGSVHGERHLESSRKQIIRMLAVVVIAFFLCWTPFHAQRLGYVYFKESSVFRTINEYLMYVSGIFYYVSSTINPILYNVMSAKYRQAFRRTLCGIQTTLHLDGPAAGALHLPPQFRDRASTWDSENPAANPRKASTASMVVAKNQATAAHPSRGRKSSAPHAVTVLPMHVAVREWNSRDNVARCNNGNVAVANGRAGGVYDEHLGIMEHRV